MLIQNTSLALQNVTLRFARDENGNPVVVAGDARGVFDVPEKDGAFLVQTPGWHVAKRVAPVLDPLCDEEAPKASEPAPKAPEADAAAPKESLPEGPDLNALDKEGLLELAKQHGVDVRKSWTEERIREALDKALFADAEGGE